MEEIQCHFETPNLYRYEDERYIDMFFETGKIMISSFQNYRSYVDNQLGDIDEGKTKTTFQITETDVVKSTTRGHIEGGNNCYSFCTSTILDLRLLKTFNRNSVFRISNMLGFAAAICKSIAGGVDQMLFGNCVYLNERMLKERLGSFQVQFEPTDSNILPVALFTIDTVSIRLL
jgi:hypothetical protein